MQNIPDSGVVFTFEEGISTSHVCPKDNGLRLELCEIMYLNFLFFFIFEVDKSGALAPTYPPSKRKSDLRSSFQRGESSYSFLLGRWSFKALDLEMIHFYLVRKAEVLDLKTFFFSDFCGQSLIL